MSHAPIVPHSLYVYLPFSVPFLLPHNLTFWLLLVGCPCRQNTSAYHNLSANISHAISCNLADLARIRRATTAITNTAENSNKILRRRIAFSAILALTMSVVVAVGMAVGIAVISIHLLRRLLYLPHQQQMFLLLSHYVLL